MKMGITSGPIFWYITYCMPFRYSMIRFVPIRTNSSVKFLIAKQLIMGFTFLTPKHNDSQPVKEIEIKLHQKNGVRNCVLLWFRLHLPLERHGEEKCPVYKSKNVSNWLHILSPPCRTLTQPALLLAAKSVKQESERHPLKMPTNTFTYTQAGLVR